MLGYTEYARAGVILLWRSLIHVGPIFVRAGMGLCPHDALCYCHWKMALSTYVLVGMRLSLLACGQVWRANSALKWWASAGSA